MVCFLPCVREGLQGLLRTLKRRTWLWKEGPKNPNTQWVGAKQTSTGRRDPGGRPRPPEGGERKAGTSPSFSLPEPLSRQLREQRPQPSAELRLLNSSPHQTLSEKPGCRPLVLEAPRMPVQGAESRRGVRAVLGSARAERFASPRAACFLWLRACWLASALGPGSTHLTCPGRGGSAALCHRPSAGKGAKRTRHPCSRDLAQRGL